jgi:hypothetical protein
MDWQRSLAVNQSTAVVAITCLWQLAPLSGADIFANGQDIAVDRGREQLSKREFMPV